MFIFEIFSSLLFHPPVSTTSALNDCQDPTWWWCLVSKIYNMAVGYKIYSAYFNVKAHRPSQRVINSSLL
jgi:hypothetical protein